MSNYTRPSVYIERNNSSSLIKGFDTESIPVFLGETPRGVANVPVLVNSWNDFLTKFSYETEPFSAKANMVDSIYGYFLNGGSKLYVCKVTNSQSKRANGVKSVQNLEIKSDVKKLKTVTPVMMSKDYCTWSNSLKVIVGSVEEGILNVQVKYENYLLENFDVSLDYNSHIYFKSFINLKSKYIEIFADTLEVGTYTFSGAKEVSNLENADYLTALNSIETIESFDILHIPYATQEAVLNKVEEIALKNKALPIYSLPKFSDISEIKNHVKTLPKNGCVYYPNILIKNGDNISLKEIDPIGHIIGVYSKIDSEIGLHKAPAGENAVIKGAISTSVVIKNSDIEELNPLGVNSLISKKEGITIWGARTLSKKTKEMYISDVRLSNFIDKTCYNNTQWAIFEPNDETLWEKIITSHSSFLQRMYDLGMLKGKTSKEAYYVKCDSDLNTDDTQENGYVISEIGYATKKPAEFVVVRISQKQ